MKKYLIYTLLIWWSFSTAWGQNSIQENDWQTIYLQGMKYKDASSNKKALQLLEKAYELHPSDSIMRDKLEIPAPTEADDLTIEAFGKAFASLHLYTPTHAFSTWLFSIATNNCVDFIRKKRLQTVYLDDIRTGNEVYEYPIPSEAHNPEETIIHQQRVQMLREVVSQLKPRYRRLVELRYFEELSYEEIAEQLNLPLGTVKVQLFRARDLLHNILTTKKDQI